MSAPSREVLRVATVMVSGHAVPATRAQKTGTHGVVFSKPLSMPSGACLLCFAQLPSSLSGALRWISLATGLALPYIFTVRPADTFDNLVSIHSFAQFRHDESWEEIPK